MTYPLQVAPWLEDRFRKDPGPRRRWGVLLELMGLSAEFTARTGQRPARVDVCTRCSKNPEYERHGVRPTRPQSLTGLCSSCELVEHQERAQAAARHGSAGSARSGPRTLGAPPPMSSPNRAAP